MNGDEGWDADAGGRRRAEEPGNGEDELERLAGPAAAGDGEALGRLLELIQPPVVRYCRARLGQGIGMLTPDDVAQDVLMAVCGALARYQPGSAGVMGFVYGITKNKVVDAFRAAGRDHSDPTDQCPDAAADTAGPDVEAVLATEVDELRRLLARLPTVYREVLVLRVALQMTAEETARLIGSTPGAVRVTQHRALNKLRGMLG